MKDGVWVRTIDEANDSNPIDMFGENSPNPVDYPHNGVIEFYTTKNAITNIYPEIGKKVDEFDDNPKYDENATVTLIKIYRQQPAKIAEEVFRKLFPEIKEVSCYNDTPLKCYGSNPEEDEGCESGELLACYPLKNGGYIVTVAHDFSGPGCASEYQFYTKKYIDGTISNSADLFPMPQLDDLLNPAKTAGHESDIAEFRKMYDKSPIDYICYDFQPPKTLSVRLHPWDCEDAYHNMDKVMLDPYNGDKIPEYTWDGEKFVKESS
ncbi:MAG: DUF3256 family protein [Bacteroidales bacterium]|nr:DUF3256 family protein [Bacteroidales bacterium]